MADGQKVPFAGSLGAVKLNVRTTDTLGGLEEKIVETRPCCEVLSDVIAESEGSLKLLWWFLRIVNYKMTCGHVLKLKSLNSVV